MDRRQFLGTLLASPWLAGCWKNRPKVQLQGQILGANHKLGHRLRQAQQHPFQGPRQPVGVLILGGGVAALCAAWRLSHAGLDDYRVLELESTLGGNSRAQSYAPSQAPWGAHYLPVPTRESSVVRRILSEMGLMRGLRDDGTPVYAEQDLCHSPEERVYALGAWEPGLIPSAGCSDLDLKHIREFEEHIETWQKWRDPKGRKAFALPLALSSPDPGVRKLDNLSMGDYLKKQGWTSERLRWYVDYGCRDDYGTAIDQTSAWAGLHYFASRDGGGFGVKDAQFVWPEGNHRLVRHLAQGLGPRQETGALVLGLRAQSDGGHQVDIWSEPQQKMVGYSAKKVIFALPTFQRRFLLDEPARPGFSYSPWTVSNLVLSKIPSSAYRPDVGLCWDNVIYQSPSLGYVVATHQTQSYQGGPSVFTHYRPWTEMEPAQARQQLLDKDWSQARDEVLAEMLLVHPDLLEVCTQIDVMQLGHAMIRPTVGFLWGAERQQACQPQGGVYFAHSDLSGISIFEEASYQGVRAAQELLRDQGRLKEDFLAVD